MATRINMRCAKCGGTGMLTRFFLFTIICRKCQGEGYVAYTSHFRKPAKKSAIKKWWNRFGWQAPHIKHKNR